LKIEEQEDIKINFEYLVLIKINIEVEIKEEFPIIQENQKIISQTFIILLCKLIKCLILERMQQIVSQFKI
jgi:hypothetical protein